MNDLFWEMVIVFCIVGLILCLIIVILNDREQEKFIANHNCKKVTEISDDVVSSVGVGTNGSVVVTPVYIPGKNGYFCDDGVTHYFDN